MRSHRILDDGKFALHPVISIAVSCHTFYVCVFFKYITVIFHLNGIAVYQLSVLPDVSRRQRVRALSLRVYR